MRKVWFLAIIVFAVACGSEKKEVSPLQPPSDEAVVEEEEKGFFESSKKELPEEKEKEYKTEFDADGVYWLSELNEPVTIGKYSFRSLTLQKNEAATLTLDLEETGDMIDLTAKKYTATQDNFAVQFSHKELGTISITGRFNVNPWSEGVEENETVVLTGTLKAGSEAEKKVEFTWSSF
ncbi:MAG: hypothetical protein POELPBGB_03077 [Bacteroidia bacterium]|nr:hypothetical protein [Bacteroidia bacterium]